MSDLIDKAEALLPCPFCGGEAELWNARDNRPAWIGCMGRCAVLISKEHTTDAEAIAAWNRRAIPARGVGDAYEAGLRTALGLIGSIGYGKNEDVDRGHEEAFRAVAKHLQDLRDAKSAALAPTDAAQAREAALREAAAVADEHTFGGAAVRDAILALISEART